MRRQGRRTPRERPAGAAGCRTECTRVLRRRKMSGPTKMLEQKALRGKRRGVAPVIGGWKVAGKTVYDWAGRRVHARPVVRRHSPGRVVPPRAGSCCRGSTGTTPTRCGSAARRAVLPFGATAAAAGAAADTKEVVDAWDGDAYTRVHAGGAAPLCAASDHARGRAGGAA